jgi:hypothetical protein
MNTKLASWYAFTAEGDTVLRCAECDKCIDREVPSVDHHSRVCPNCGVECVYLNWKGRMLQIVLKNAPPVFVQAIRLAQRHFDELEYVELVSALEQLMDDLYSGTDEKSALRDLK